MIRVIRGNKKKLYTNPCNTSDPWKQKTKGLYLNPCDPCDPRKKKQKAPVQIRVIRVIRGDKKQRPLPQSV